MKCVMVMFDSLNRHMLPNYQPGTPVKAPNFERLGRHAATFDRSYVCSMPCMPARRDFHTGRPNFLHCDWGPIEPFDDSVPQMLSDHGVYTHLCSDHYHYWEDGGATYHNRYDSWQFNRGQEGDPWIGQVRDPEAPPHLGHVRRADLVNRSFMDGEDAHPQSRTFADGLDFIHRNHDQDFWFLQIECFDPHEPFFTHPRLRAQYPDDPLGMPMFDWPKYGKVTETPPQVEAARRNYAALVSQCDENLGRVLDQFDEHGLWDDTMLIVWTDHGFLLGEHGWWGKGMPPLYDQIARTPFFVWDPRVPSCAGVRRASLVQPAIDLGPTLLSYFGMERTPDMRGHDLTPVTRHDDPVRDAALFGYFGKSINLVTDRYAYFRQPAEHAWGSLNAYTLMPTKMRGFKDLDGMDLVDPLPHTKGMKVLKLPRGTNPPPVHDRCATSLLFDIIDDPTQSQPVEDTAIEKSLCYKMAELLTYYDAPVEQYPRVALPAHELSVKGQADYPA